MATATESSGDVRPRAKAVLACFAATIALGIVLLVAFEPDVQTIDAAELVAAIERVVAGDAYFSPRLAAFVLQAFSAPEPAPTDDAELQALTPREREVLELIARGMSNREIATALTVEESTIRTHVKRILMKLDLRDRVQVVIFAYETGLAHPGSITT